jgi:hypothetical protein
MVWFPYYDLDAYISAAQTLLLHYYKKGIYDDPDIHSYYGQVHLKRFHRDQSRLDYLLVSFVRCCKLRNHLSWTSCM